MTDEDQTDDQQPMTAADVSRTMNDWMRAGAKRGTVQPDEESEPDIGFMNRAIHRAVRGRRGVRRL